MDGRTRFAVMVGIIVLACSGCSKGNQAASQATPDMAEAKKADAKEPVTKTTSKAAHKTEQHAAAATKEKETASTPKKAVSGALTEAENGLELDFRPGQTITVVLDSNHASGLSWSLVGSSGDVVKPEGSPSYAVRTGKNGGGTETWHFKALKPGYETVKMEYRRKWAQSVPERTFRFSANVR